MKLRRSPATGAARHRVVLALTAALGFAAFSAWGQPHAGKPLDLDKFRQLDELLPTPTTQRTASGAPGHAYWQQRADYEIEAELDEKNHKLSGRETITYHNRSPDTLEYLWLQLDANLLARDAAARTAAIAPDLARLEYHQLDALLYEEKYGSDLAISAVTDASGAPLKHTIVGTMMRVDLPIPLAPGASLAFRISWAYTLNLCKVTPETGVPRRTCYEIFERDGNPLYAIAQWYPRMAVYGDTTGWHHKQYLGRGEFALEFGDFLVHLTVPDDYIIAATGALQNPQTVLTAAQRQRLEQAETAQRPLFIVTPAEAKASESRRSGGRKTWTFRADNVRDFAFAASPRFIWDAMGAAGHLHAGRPVMAMSFYPPEGEPLWGRYSTHAVIHTLDVYSRATFEYPWPVAQSVNTPISMEYPMLAFSGTRPEPDGSYGRDIKYGLISLIIHEFGHNYFPMIVNSDERQWSWMDEGMNTFLNVAAELEWEESFASGWKMSDVLAYMSGADQSPIMTHSDSIEQFISATYNKPLAALHVLREAVLGPQAFDHAFRTYARRWKFKRPYPADFFRTMEDASGVDLDWFWRGWFYTNDHVDVAIEGVRRYTLDTRDPAIEKARAKQKAQSRSEPRFHRSDPPRSTRVESYPELEDFYNRFDETNVLPSEKQQFEALIDELRAEDIDPALLRSERYFYAVELKNVGGLVTPLLFEIGYADGSTEELYVPAEIWRLDSERVTKLFLTQKEITSLALDRDGKTADADTANNVWPRVVGESRLRLFKQPRGSNPMREIEQ